MSKYNKRCKVYVTIDENNSFWIIAESGKIVCRNPTKEELDKVPRIVRYNDSNICPRCREENNISDNSILYPQNAVHDTDKCGKKTDEWVCIRHGRRHYGKYNRNSSDNIRKSKSGRRTGILDPNSNQALGDDCEEETYRLFGAKRLSVELDNYRLSNDHGPIPEGVSIMIEGKLVDLSNKIPQTRGKSYDSKYGAWIQNLDVEHNKKFDILIFYCVSEDRKIIERVYIFPKHVLNMVSIGIYKNPSRGIQWYEKYRITDEVFLNKANEIWRGIVDRRKKCI